MKRHLLFVMAFLSSSIGMAPAAPAQTGWQTYSADPGSTSFSYPSGWRVIETDRTPARFLENFAIQPAGQSFSGNRGEVVIRIFDPMFVIEEARSALPASNPEQLFQRFVRGLPGGSAATFGRRASGGVNYYYASDTSEGFEADYVGFVGRNGYLNVVGMAVHTADAPSRQQLLLQIAGSLRSPAPTTGSDGPSAAVANWYRYLRAGNAVALGALACSQARPMMAIASLLTRGSTQATIMAARGFDFSGLRYQTLGQQSGRAMVRVAGNVVAPNGAVVPFYQYAQGIGGSNSFFVTLEGSSWHVCGPVRGGYR